METWRGHSSLCPFKRGATEVPFQHRCISSEIFGVAKDFCQNFPKLSRKVFCATFTYKFFPTKIMRTFFGATYKKVMLFSGNLGHHFLKSNKVRRHFHADFQGCCPDFQQTKTFGVALSPPPPTSNTAFQNSIIGNFVVYQD